MTDRDLEVIGMHKIPQPRLAAPVLSSRCPVHGPVTIDSARAGAVVELSCGCSWGWIPKNEEWLRIKEGDK